MIFNSMISIVSYWLLLANKLKPYGIFYLKNVKIELKKWIQYNIFSSEWYDWPKNKMLHNFHITNPNGMNQIVKTMYTKIWFIRCKFLKLLFQVFVDFFCCLVRKKLYLGWQNICSLASIEIKIIFLQS